MLLFGYHAAISSAKFYYVKEICALEARLDSSKSNLFKEQKRATNAQNGQGLESASNKAESIFWCYARDDRDFKLSAYAREQNLNFGVVVSNIEEFVAFASFSLSYLMVENNAKMYQRIADNYLLDSKVLAIIESRAEIEESAKSGIDGVIMRDLLVDK